jgi:Na+-transporting NADH:ubiquinone oxidoreductase subunit C
MKNSPLYSIFFVTLVAGFFALTVSSLEWATKDRVEAANAFKVQKNVLYALGFLPPLNKIEVSKLFESRIKKEALPKASPNGSPQVLPYWRFTDKNGATLAFALSFKSPGFWGPIEGILGVDKNGEVLTGIAFTKEVETPGLGARINEEWFKDQFKKKKIRPIKKGKEVLSFVNKKPTKANEVEAITGATETSKRLGSYLNQLLIELRDHPAFLKKEGRLEK